MNIPGFTAEVTLFSGTGRYRAAAESVYGGTVQPAASDTISLYPPIPVHQEDLYT
jgi:hypothetical protein